MAGSTMKLFQSARNFFQSMGAKTVSHNSNKIDLFNLNFLFCSLSMALVFIAATAFLLFEASSLTDIAISFYGSITELCSLILLHLFSWQIPNVHKLIKKYEHLIEKRSKCDALSKIMYTNIIEKIEQFSRKCHLFLVKLTLIGTLMPPFIITYVSYFIFDMGEESFQDIPAMLPFDTKTPLGFFVASIFQAAETLSISLTAISFICFLIGSCWLFFSFANDLKTSLHPLNINSEPKGVHTKLLIDSLHEIVLFFSDVKELINEFNAIYKFMTFDLFLWSLLSICSTLMIFVAQLSLKSSNPAELIVPLVLMFWSFILLFFICEFGEKVNNQFESFNDELCQLNWYFYSHDIQRTLLIFMTGAQQPVFLSGYGNIICTRDAFEKTVHSGFSYFMTLRQL